MYNVIIGMKFPYKIMRYIIFLGEIYYLKSCSINNISNSFLIKNIKMF